MNTVLFMLMCIIFFSLSCTKQVIKQTPQKEEPSPVYFSSHGDTTTYDIVFSDKKEKRVFAKDFKKYLEKYQFESIVSDTIQDYFKINIFTEEREAREPMIIPQNEAAFSEVDIEGAEAVPEEDKALPAQGGSVTIYTARKFLDKTLSDFIQVVPFSQDTIKKLFKRDTVTTSGFLHVSQISTKKIQIECTPAFINSKGVPITAFDLVGAWTEYIKKYPAEGLALFPYVKGVHKFIRGEEGIIPGFSVVNEKTIRILLEQSDPRALKRLQSPRLLLPSLSLGPYYIKKHQGTKYLLFRNAAYPFTKSFLDQCTIICGNDKNPIITFSLNKYDMVIMYTKKDLAYVKRTLSQKAVIKPFVTEKYFISTASQSSELRQALVQLIDPDVIYTNAVRAEGAIITALESEEEHKPTQKESSPLKNLSFKDPVTIVYHTGDPVSISIAEKLFSDFTHAGLGCKLQGMKEQDLQSTLAKRAYDIAIGWVPQSIVTDQAEQLRCAVIWFNGITDENKRIAEHYEVPLFSIKWYALCKNDIAFYNNKLRGIFRIKKD